MKLLITFENAPVTGGAMSFETEVGEEMLERLRNIDPNHGRLSVACSSFKPVESANAWRNSVQDIHTGKTEVDLSRPLNYRADASLVLREDSGETHEYRMLGAWPYGIESDLSGVTSIEFTYERIDPV